MGNVGLSQSVWIALFRPPLGNHPIWDQDAPGGDCVRPGPNCQEALGSPREVRRAHGDDQRHFFSILLGRQR